MKLWDAESGKLLASLTGHEGYVYSVAWSPDGKRIASASNDKTVKLWDAESGKLLASLTGHEHAVNSVAWSPDGKRIASASNDETVKLWDAESGKLLASLTGHEGGVNSVAWSPDGKRIASASFDKTVKLWDAKSGKLLASLTGHEYVVNSVAWSPDGKRIASASNDKTVKLWDAESGKLLASLTGHEGYVYSVAWSPDGKRIASASNDKTVKLWDAESGKLLASLTGHEGAVNSVAWSPDGKRIASASFDKTVKLWDAKSGKLLAPLTGHEGPVSSVAWSPDGKRIASAGYDETVKLWDAESGKLLAPLTGHENVVSSVAWSPDGKRIASGSYDRTVKLWDAESGKLLASLTGHEGLVLSVAWSPDGKRIASASFDKTVELWDAESGKLLAPLTGHENVVSSVAWSPDGKRIASASSDTVKLWDAESGKLLTSLTGHEGPVSSVAWSPDGKRIASAGYDETVKLWDAESGKLLASLTGYDAWVNSVAWSPDGKRIGAASGLSVLCADSEKKQSTFEIEFVNLPGTEWISFRPGSVLYCGSLQCDQFAGLRFNNQFQPIYPLYYWHDELKRDGLLPTESPPVIKPEPVRLWWDTFENKGIWAGALLGALGSGTTIYLVARKRGNALAVASEFFREAGAVRQQRLAPNLLRVELPASGMTDREANVTGLLALWDEACSAALYTKLQKIRDLGGDRIIRVYLLHSQVKPQLKILQKWRRELGCEVIPVHMLLLKRAVSRHESERVLNEVEEPYVIRRDPYLESKPILDPTWFFGREEILDRITSVLAQGQHAGLFGLRKIGKTSLINQIQQRLEGTATALVDCQAFGDSPAEYLLEIIRQLRSELTLLAVCRRFDPIQQTEDTNTLRKYFLDLFDLWRAAGKQQPFLIILDEVDKVFPCEDLTAGEPTLREYVRLFRVLRGLAQTKLCLVLLVVAYRPDVNRRNLLTIRSGENPMFRSYQEEYLGCLQSDESASLLREVGQWRQIEWDSEAMDLVYRYCGGHPLITRLFASEATEKGNLKLITSGRVEEIAAQVVSTFWKNSIGNYYSEGVWNLLRSNEQILLEELINAGENGWEKIGLTAESDEALTNLENFGLVRSECGRFRVAADLFRKWLETMF